MNRLSIALVGSVLGLLAVAAACGGDDGGASPEETLDGSTGVDVNRPNDATTPNDARADVDGAPFVVSAHDINHILGTGQSLSVGAAGEPPLSTKQPYDNMMFNTGVIAGGTNLTSFVDLAEGPTVETFSSEFANEISKLGTAKHDLLISGHGISGRPYSVIKKGGTEPAYANGMAQVKAGHDLAVAAGKTYVVRGVTNVHGESDHQIDNAHYKEDMIEFQSNYDADVKAMTGQTEPVPMFMTQFSTWTIIGGGNHPTPITTSIIPAQMLAAHIERPGKIVLVGAKYHLPYAADGLHLTNVGYQHMGEDYAKVYKHVVLEGKTWEPIRPKKVTRAGKVITVQFFVPSPPLVMDTTIVSDPGKNGFEFAQTGSVVAIESVAIAGADTVTITLASEPTGTNQRIRYAFTGTSGAKGGPTTGPRGNLRDSDATPSLGNYPLFNWCIHFDEVVP